MPGMHINTIRGALKSSKTPPQLKKALRKKLKIINARRRAAKARSGTKTRTRSTQRKTSKQVKRVAKRRRFARTRKVARKQGLSAGRLANELKWSIAYSVIGQPLLVNLMGRLGMGGSLARGVGSFLIASNTKGALRSIAKAGVLLEANQAAAPLVGNLIGGITSRLSGSQTPQSAQVVI